jgi:hypothetical protein
MINGSNNNQLVDTDKFLKKLKTNKKSKNKIYFNRDSEASIIDYR